jgi:hypothetical protein
MKTLWKSMALGLRSGMGNNTWTIGKWEKHDGTLIMCQSGFHASVRAIDAMSYVACEVLAEVEVRGKKLVQEDKQCWSEMRVVKAFLWEKKDSVALSVFAAELVIGNYEKVCPNDKRPRQAIEAAKTWLKNPTVETSSASSAAFSAASSAACSAARSAARSAAWSAAESASSAARSAACSAAFSAACSAARSAGSAAESARSAALDPIEAWIQVHIAELKEI